MRKQAEIIAKPAAELTLFPRGIDPGEALRAAKGEPGTLSSLWTVEAGCLAAFETDPMVRAYLNNGVVIRVLFESAEDAETLMQKLTCKGSA